jgi:glycosyltransferase involved in cell wall biosynthesis
MAVGPPRAGPMSGSRSVVHLGSRDHERWSIQQLVLAVTSSEFSQREVAAMGLAGRDVMCWCPGYWRELADSCRCGSRAVCFFHHTDQIVFANPEIAAGICMNRTMQRQLQASCPGKPIQIARVGGVDDARAYATRRHPTEKIRLLVTGMADAPLIHDHERGRPEDTYPLRKSPELLLPIADRLDPDRYAWVFIGQSWQPYVDSLTERGWTVIHPGLVGAPFHYCYFGEGDIYLMLSRLEGGPLPLLETMGLGIWPVCTPTGIAPDIVQSGYNGYLTHPYDGNNVQVIADEVAMFMLTLDNEQLRVAAPTIRATVVDHTWSRFKSDVDQILTQVFT